MPAVSSPRITRVMLTALAWSALPLAAFTAAAGIFDIADERDVIVSAAAAIIASLWALMRRVAGNVEKRAQRVDARQAALIKCIDKALSRPRHPETGPQPIPMRPYDAA